MNDGEIFGNTVDSYYYGYYGGGVYVYKGTFTKNGGTIYGSNEDDKSNKASYGKAVYANSSPAKKMENTVGPGVYLFFNYNNGNPVWSGGWE